MIKDILYVLLMTTSLELSKSNIESRLSNFFLKESSLYATVMNSCIIDHFTYLWLE